MIRDFVVTRNSANVQCTRYVTNVADLLKVFGELNDNGALWLECTPKQKAFMKRAAVTCVLLLAECEMCRKCLGFKLATGDDTLRDYIGCYFWFYLFDEQQAAEPAPPSPLVPAHMNASLNLSVALHQAHV